MGERRLGRLVAVVGLAAASLAGMPAAGAQEAPAAPGGERYREAVFDEVTITRDVPFRQTVNSQGNPVTLRLDLYEPAGDTAAQRPVILLMSGGFLNFIDKGLLLGAGEGYAQAGYVVVSIEYRVRPEMDMSGFPDVFDQDELTAASLDAYDDALAAVQWLRDHAEQYRLDPRAIIASGASAGAGNAWLLAWLPGGDVRPGPPAVAAAVSLSGAPLELAHPNPEAPPLLVIHGRTDTVIPYAWAADACNSAAAAGARCDLITYEGGHPLVDANGIVPAHQPEIARQILDFQAEAVLAPLGYFDSAPPDTTPPDPGPPPTTPTPVAPPPTAPAAPAATPVVAVPVHAG